MTVEEKDSSTKFIDNKVVASYRFFDSTVFPPVHFVQINNIFKMVRNKLLTI